MYREQESQKNEISNQNNDNDFKPEGVNNDQKPLQNRLPQFLHDLTEQTMKMVQGYFERNSQKIARIKKPERKIKLYEDLNWIRQFKKRQDDLVDNKRGQVMQSICSTLSGFRSAITIKERVQKMLSKLNNQQIKYHIERNQDFCFDNKKNLVSGKKFEQNMKNTKEKLIAVEKECNSNQIYQSDDLHEKRTQKSRITSFTSKKQKMQAEQKTPNLSLEKRREGKQSVDSKVTDGFNNNSGQKLNGRSVNNQNISDLPELLILVYNRETKTIQCIKRQQPKVQKSQIQPQRQILEQVKQVQNEAGSMVPESKQPELQIKPNQSLIQIDKIRQNHNQNPQNPQNEPQNNQVVNSTPDSENKSNIVTDAKLQGNQNPNASNHKSQLTQVPKKIKAKPKTVQIQVQNQGNLEDNMKKLRYQISNNDSYLSILNEDPKLAIKYIFQKEQDEALIKFNQNKGDQTLTIKCMLRYKGLELIEQRLKFLNIPITPSFYQAANSFSTQKAQLTNYQKL